MANSILNGQRSSTFTRSFVAASVFSVAFDHPSRSRRATALVSRQRDRGVYAWRNLPVTWLEALPQNPKVEVTVKHTWKWKCLQNLANCIHAYIEIQGLTEQWESPRPTGSLAYIDWYGTWRERKSKEASSMILLKVSECITYCVATAWVLYVGVLLFTLSPPGVVVCWRHCCIGRIRSLSGNCVSIK